MFLTFCLCLARSSKLGQLTKEIVERVKEFLVANREPLLQHYQGHLAAPEFFHAVQVVLTLCAVSKVLFPVFYLHRPTRPDPMLGRILGGFLL